MSFLFDIFSSTSFVLFQFVLLFFRYSSIFKQERKRKGVDLNGREDRENLGVTGKGETII